MVQRIVEMIRRMEASDEKLVLLVGKPGSGKSQFMRELSAKRGWEYVDCRKLVTEELLELVPQARAAAAPEVMSNLLAKMEAEVILLDSIQVLFAPVLQLDPLSLLRQISRKQTLVAAWPGLVCENKLVFNQDGRVSHREYDAEQLVVLEL